MLCVWEELWCLLESLRWCSISLLFIDEGSHILVHAFLSKILGAGHVSELRLSQILEGSNRVHILRIIPPRGEENNL